MAGTNKGFRIFANIIMILLMLCCLLPFILLITASITDEATLTLYGYSFFPKKINFRAYEYLFQAAGKIARAYGVTILITAVGTTLNVTMTMFMSYLLSKQDLPGRNFLSFFIFFTMLFSGGYGSFLYYMEPVHACGRQPSGAAPAEPGIGGL